LSNQKIAQKPGNALSNALLMPHFQKLRRTPPKKNPAFAQFFETPLRTVLIDQLICINSGPKILRSHFRHWKSTIG